MILHAYTQYTPRDEDTKRRNALAQSTWPGQLWKECPVRDEELPRMWREEGRSFAFIHDVIEHAAKQASNPQDIIAYTNADIIMRGDASHQLIVRMKSVSACYAFRRDFGRLEKVPVDSEFSTGYDYCGSDLKAFTKGWWDAHKNQLPDAILGGEAWDPCYRVMIEQSQPGKNVSLRDIIAHERHASYWEVPQNRHRLDMQKYCLSVCAKFLQSHGVPPGQHGIDSRFILQPATLDAVLLKSHSQL